MNYMVEHTSIQTLRICGKFPICLPLTLSPHMLFCHCISCNAFLRTSLRKCFELIQFFKTLPIGCHVRFPCFLPVLVPFFPAFQDPFSLCSCPLSSLRYIRRYPPAFVCNLMFIPISDIYFFITRKSLSTSNERRLRVI